MKYIRTKDGRVFDKSKETIVFDILYPRGEELLSRTVNLKEDILKQADTIEELVDAYVIFPKDKKYKPYTENTLSVFDDVKDVLRHNDIYLSIWLEDGTLKSKAKMNEKGELELL